MFFVFFFEHDNLIIGTAPKQGLPADSPPNMRGSSQHPGHLLPAWVQPVPLQQGQGVEPPPPGCC